MNTNKTVKTLQECKDEVARLHELHDFLQAELKTVHSENPIAIQILDEAAELYASEKVKERDERIKELLKLLEKVEPVLLNSCDELEGQWGILSKSARLQSVHKEVREALSKNKESEKVD